MKLGVRFSCMMALAVGAWAQTSTTTTGTSTNGTTSTNNPSGSTTGTTTTNQPTTPAPGSGSGRPIFLSGKVMMDDGSPLPVNVSIQSICGPLRRAMGHTTTDGGFAFQWTTVADSFGDASQVNKATSGPGSSSLTGSRTGSRGMDPLANCELQAESAGYSSNRVSLYDRAGQSTFDIGVIVLRRISGDEGRTVSLLALKAPKEARKSFEKGTSLAIANKPAEAMTNFETAVRLYPQYADAWLGLGKIQWQLERKEDARESFRKSMELDNNLVGPWEELGYMACDDAKWEDAVRYLDQAVHLDPMDSPAAWYFSALANYNLGRFDRAERSVRAALKLDNGKNSQANYVLAQVLIARKDLAGGAEALRMYIATSSKTGDVETAKRELSRLETQLGTSLGTSHYAEGR